MSTNEKKYVVVANSITLDGSTFEKGEILNYSDLKGRSVRLLQMGVIRLIDPDSDVDKMTTEP